MNGTIYVLRFQSEDRCEVINAYERRCDAVQELQKELKKRRHVSWKKRSEDHYDSEDLEKSIRVVEIELVTDEVDPREEVRW